MFFSYNRLLHVYRIKKQNKENNYYNFRCSISLRRIKGKKRTFYTSSGGYTYKRASLTVEAAMVFPIFIFAFWIVLYGFKITELQAKVQYALNVVAEEMAAYSDVKSKTAASALFISGLKSCDADVSFVSGTWTGFSLGKSNIQKKDSMVYLEVAYRIKLPQLLRIKFTVPCTQSVWTRAFHGRSLKEKSAGKIVYITTGQTVYHTNRQCSYLNLSIQKITEADFSKQRHRYLKQYKACSTCKNIEGYGYIYITESGTKYHYTLACKNLKRTIQRVMLEEVNDRRLCSRCNKNTHKN